MNGNSNFVKYSYSSYYHKFMHRITKFKMTFTYMTGYTFNEDASKVFCVGISRVLGICPIDEIRVI